MSPWIDVVDWVGGYPFEVARPRDVIGFYEGKGFSLVKMNACGKGYGCNEFIFKRTKK
jgi:2-polyprenyl-6-hydroxyphenyl methylase/3-demethylubiquinone-9 3-methyltransferase